MASENKTVKDMTSGNPFKLILLFSIPLLIGNLFQQFYNMVDTIIVGQSLGNNALAAVGSTGPINFLVLGFANGITSGFSVQVAQRFGAGDEKGLRKAVASATVLVTLFTILLTFLSVIGTKWLLTVTNTPEEIFDDAYNYIVTIFAGMFTIMAYNILACFLRALGDSRTPLYFLIISAVLNIGLDFLFILSFKMGVRGAAIATVVSQGISAILCFIYIIVRFPILHLKKDDFIPVKCMYFKHLNIGLPMAFQFSITAIGTVVLQGALNLFGAAHIAAFTAASKVEQLVTQAAPSFGVAMANYSGQNLGADKVDRIKDGVAKCSILTILFSILAGVIIYLFGEPLVKMFLEEDTAVIMDNALLYLHTMVWFFPPLFMIFVYRNMLQGVGKSFMPLMAGVFELIARSLCAFILPGRIGFMGICLAGPIAWVSAAVPLCITYFIVIKKMMEEWRERHPEDGALAR